MTLVFRPIHSCSLFEQTPPVIKQGETIARGFNMTTMRMYRCRFQRIRLQFCYRILTKTNSEVTDDSDMNWGSVLYIIIKWPVAIITLIPINVELCNIYNFFKDIQ